MNKKLASIKNDNEQIRYTTPQDTFISIEELLKDTQRANAATVVYKCDLQKGTATPKKVDLRYNNIVEESFWKQYIAYWYMIEQKAIESAMTDISAEIPFDDEEAEAIRIAKARKNDFDQAYNKYIPKMKLSEIAETVKILVLCDHGAKDKAFPDYIKNALTPLLKSIESYDKEEVGTKAYKTAFEAVKTAIQENFCQNIWQEKEGTILPYVFNCNTRLALNVTKVAYGGLTRNKDGKIAVAKTKPEAIIREIVYQCFVELQNKASEKIEETVK